MDMNKITILKDELISFVPRFPAIVKMKLKGNLVQWMLFNLVTAIIGGFAIFSDLIIQNFLYQIILFLITLIVFFTSAIFLIQEEETLNVEEKEVDEIRKKLKEKILNCELSKNDLIELKNEIKPKGLMHSLNKQYERFSNIVGLIFGWVSMTVFLITGFWGIGLIKVINAIESGDGSVFPFLFIVSFIGMFLVYICKSFLDVVDRFSGNFQRRVVLQQIKDIHK
ncbi:hypothetical protein [Thiomicrospira sp. S5]|uniref:hypothetical protein n=1 Tax=Thiomicrospira sp. S5 TaxID=1803865 RepID=UPI0004A77F66|nr:hypothetical protein [Thiomicrospira sp. S5]AZR81889.1 hypothetical protein AYJ59_06095 [Thiomicrospira sp. S5]